MIALLRADLLKTRARPMGWMMLGLSAILTGLVILLARVSAERNGLPPESWSSALLLGPRFIGQSLGGLMLVIYGATLVGAEYSYDTWKLLLIRRAGRSCFILSKWLTLALSVALAVAALGLVSLALCLAVGVARLDAPPGPGPGAALGGLLVQALALIAAGGVALFGAVAWRSSVAGIICGIVWIVADGLLALAPGVPPWGRGLLLGVVIDDLMAHLGLGGLPAYAALWDALALAIYATVPPSAAALIFRRRDMLGAA